MTKGTKVESSRIELNCGKRFNLLYFFNTESLHHIERVLVSQIIHSLSQP